MATGPNYRVPLKRRRKQKTNYYRRRGLLKSRRLRLVVRPSLKNITVQLVKAEPDGDKILVSATSTELLNKYGWKVARGNLPAAYLTGYLAGKKAIKAGFKDAILDIGLNVPQNGTRVFAALKGAVDAGMEIPHREEKLPSEERIQGQHIAEYGKMLAEQDKDLYKKVFSAYTKVRLKPENVPKYFAETKKKIDNDFK